MNNDNQSRRHFVVLASAGLAAASALALTAGTAQADQGNMDRALGALQAALIDLHHASSDKGGHKARAVGLIQQAIGEVQAGIDFAADHFGD